MFLRNYFYTSLIQTLKHDCPNWLVHNSVFYLDSCLQPRELCNQEVALFLHHLPSTPLSPDSCSQSGHCLPKVLVVFLNWVMLGIYSKALSSAYYKLILIPEKDTHLTGFKWLSITFQAALHCFTLSNTPGCCAKLFQAWE